jgi:hypothetical protein
MLAGRWARSTGPRRRESDRQFQLRPAAERAQSWKHPRRVRSIRRLEPSRCVHRSETGRMLEMVKRGAVRESVVSSSSARATLAKSGEGKARNGCDVDQSRHRSFIDAEFLAVRRQGHSLRQGHVHFSAVTQNDVEWRKRLRISQRTNFLDAHCTKISPPGAVCNQGNGNITVPDSYGPAPTATQTYPACS